MSVNSLSKKIAEQLEPHLRMAIAERVFTDPGRVGYCLSQLFEADKDLELVKAILVDENGSERFIAVKVVRKDGQEPYVSVTNIVSSEYALDQEFIVAESQKGALKLVDTPTIWGPFKEPRRPRTRSRRRF